MVDLTQSDDDIEPSPPPATALAYGGDQDPATDAEMAEYEREHCSDRYNIDSMYSSFFDRDGGGRCPSPSPSPPASVGLEQMQRHVDEYVDPLHNHDRASVPRGALGIVFTGIQEFVP